MAILSVARVNEIFGKCLYRENDDVTQKLHVSGVMHSAELHRQRLEEHREAITELLMQLPEAFRESKSGPMGASFLLACDDYRGVQWASHQMDMEVLMILGLGIGKVQLPYPKELWHRLVGSMPFYVVIDS